MGASLLATVVNDNACVLTERGALESIASRLAPTGEHSFRGEGASSLATGCVLLAQLFFASRVSPLSHPPPRDL
ncbi:hypothetical protein CD175_02990 [Pseudomonas laurylsulfatiphila]|uniref:Uncharacterized protein n=1 Tax=Pseudomonas laurylsulfatiphila TaxID=2011015 RepID=A0A2S6FSM5_9PSED|nr:hypothetical protein CD175_02990 [Pseudomonas laurylsulfatiphila]